MGVVFRGEHEATRAAAAIKVVSGASIHEIAGLRREIHALGRVQHPGVVRILEQGLAAGLPWYAMELLEGRTLRALLIGRRRSALEHAGTEDGDVGARSTRPAADPSESGSGGRAPRAIAGPPDARLIELCAELCEPLAAVHAAGLVHRDLKPDNVVVTSEGRPVLVDFGVAAGFGGAAGREVIDAAGAVAGTLNYMAPEQIRGELCDARADLYALGCILYECIAGRAPFEGLPPRDLLRAHALETPRPPSELGVVIAPELEVIVLRLLAKRPAERVGYAADVASMLRDLGYGSGPRAVPEARAEPYLYRAELTGRADVMDHARAALDRLARDRSGGAIYMGGESGAGKTRIGVEITREAALRGLSVVTGQCVPAGREGATPLHPLLPLVRDALARARLDRAGAIARPHARVLAPYFPEAALVPGLDSLPEPPPLSPDAARARVLDAAEAVVLTLAEGEPLLLVLDDVHWADELSIALLGRLDAAKLAARGVLCVCLYRAEEAGDALVALAGAPGVERWELGRLDEGSVAAMAAGMLATKRLPRAWAELLGRVSGGNPFFAAEYLRAAVEAGILARDRRGQWSLRAADAALGEALSLPSTIEALLNVRFDRLGSEERRLLAAAAVLGRALAGDVATATAGMDERAALTALSGLTRRQILEEAAGGQLRFVHDRLRDAAYARLEAADRRALHGRAAEAIEARHGDDPAHFEPIAGHHAGAGRRDAAYWYYSLAAAQAEAVYANEQAIALRRASIAQAEAGGAADARRFESFRRLGELLHASARADEALDAYARALAHLGPDAGVERARLHLAMGSTREARQQHAEALAAYAEAERCLGEAPGAGDDEDAWWKVWIQIGIERITIHYYAADMEALARVVAAIGPVVERRGTHQQRAYFFLSLVQRDLRGARYRTSPETILHARRSLAGFARGDDRRKTANARFTLAAVLLWSDALDEAEREMLAALDESEAVGAVWIQVACLAYLSVIARRRRDVDAARAVAFRCLSAALAAEALQYAGVAEASLGWVHLESGGAEEALRLCRAALSRWRGMPLAYPFQWLARFVLMKLASASGRRDEAREHAAAIIEVTQQRLPEALEGALAGDDVAQALRIAEDLGFI
jgi:serine/threonine protein kinase/tetratricopeptide (TPR) repeat protein